jgi:hypothetical protein
MLNKTYNLVYGMFLNQLRFSVEILSFKPPSFVKKVNFKEITDNLYKTEISTDTEKDKGIKKLIAKQN